MKWNGQYPEPQIEHASVMQTSVSYLVLIIFCLFFWALLIGGVMWAGGWFN